MNRDDVRRFTGVTFFIGYTEKGVTREARQHVDESVLWEQARKGSQAVRESLQQGPIRIMVEELLRDFLAEFIEQEQRQKEFRGLMGIFSSGGPASETVRRVRELLGDEVEGVEAEGDFANPGCDSPTGDVQAKE